MSTSSIQQKTSPCISLECLFSKFAMFVFLELSLLPFLLLLPVSKSSIARLVLSCIELPLLVTTGNRLKSNDISTAGASVKFNAKIRGQQRGARKDHMSSPPVRWHCDLEIRI